MEYRIYSINTVLYLLYKARLRRLNTTKVFFYKMKFKKSRHCILLYEPDSYGDVQHLSFYALSTGWKKVTETGFKSLFLQFKSDRDHNVPSYKEMEKYWKAYSYDQGLILDDESHQLGLF